MSEPVTRKANISQTDADKAVASYLHKKSAVSVHDEETCPANMTHEVIYIQFGPHGATIRKWARTPFNGSRKCRVELTETIA